jgi:hypothetical protein
MILGASDAFQPCRDELLCLRQKFPLDPNGYGALLMQYRQTYPSLLEQHHLKI